MISDRQVVVMQLVADGMSQREVAEKVGYAEQTVKNMKGEVREQLGARNTVHAVSILMRSGVLR